MAKETKHKYVCEYCHYICYKIYNYTQHLLTAKHKNNSICQKVAEIAKKYACECCDYTCGKKSDYTKHLNTVKHKNNNSLKNGNAIEENTTKDTSSNEIKLLTGLIVEVVKSNNDLQKQNQDLQKQVLEICKNNNNSNTINNNTSSVINSHNKTFNLQFFLNEDCKDAMNMSEFINSIQLKISDLENIGKVGYVEGISNIIIKQLNDTQINKRPVHCSDSKRETLYVKEENKWEKDTDKTKKMARAVQDVDRKTSMLLLTEWKEMNPKCTDSKSKQCEEFTNLAGEVNDGDETNVKKVIKRVAKYAMIDK
jgi:hypothetical protein